MTDQTISAQPADAPMQRLADHLTRLVPPPAARPLISQPSPAVAAALARTAAETARIARRARRRGLVRATIESFVSACAFIPYAVVALALRLVIARVFFLDGQSKIAGTRVAFDLQGFDVSVVLPMQVKAETFAAFMTKYSMLPLPPAFAAYLVSYAEFILPVMLVIGLGTRFAAFGLLVMTAVIQIFVLQDALWSTHIYWAAILMVLLSLGAGPISLDHIVRYVARR